MIETTRAMISTANEQMTALENDLATINQEITAAEQELAARQLTIKLHQEKVEAARLESVHTEQKFKQADSYAKLAQHKPNEKTAIRDLAETKKAHEAASKQYHDLKTEELPNVAEIEQQLRNLREAKGHCLEEIDSIELGRGKAHLELGEQLAAKLQQDYRTRKDEIEGLEKQILYKKAALLLLYHQSLEDLQDWPDHKRDFAKLETPEDGTLRVLEAVVLCMDTLLADMGSISQSIPLPSLYRANPFFTGYQDLRPELFIDQAYIIDLIRRQPYALAKRRNLIKDLLTEYREYLNNKHAESL